MYDDKRRWLRLGLVAGHQSRTAGLDRNHELGVRVWCAARRPAAGAGSPGGHRPDERQQRRRAHMNLTLRAFVTAGVALTAATAIAVAPAANAPSRTTVTRPDHHTRTGGAVPRTGKLTSTVTPQRSTITTSGRPTPTPHLPTAAATPATPTGKLTSTITPQRSTITTSGRPT